MILWIIYGFSIGFLYWIYDGYGRFLQLAAACRNWLQKSSAADTDSSLPTMTVLLTVHNEQDVVGRRITDILACEYPGDSLRVLVASDGSTDATNQIVSELADADSRITLFESNGLGKTATQNLAVEMLNTEIVVFTDADIRFDKSFLLNVARRFSDARVGAVDGRLRYEDGSDDPLAQGQGYYWRYEHKVRKLESELGILAVVAGACFAVRRSLLLKMDPSIGEDCIVPLDVVSQKALVVHEPSAVAWDAFDEGNAFAFRRRIRMTLRNWQGTWTRPDLLNPLRHPGYALALWSHKLLRWLSPMFVVLAVVSSATLVYQTWSPAAWSAVTPLALLFALGSCGWFFRRSKVRIPGAGTAFSFLLANLAFLVGVVRAVSGHRIQRYQKA